MIWKFLGLTPETSLNGSIAINTVALTNGANILRVHDVAETKQMIDLFHKTLTSADNLWE
jgi:dihydropteroate synthase